MGEIMIQLTISGLLWGVIFSLIALGLTLIYGMMGIINFSHGEFLMVAMYIALWLSVSPGIDPLLSWPIGVIILGVLGFLVYRLLIKHVLKAPRFAQMFCTFGLMIFLQGLAQFLWGTDFRNVRNPLLAGVWRVGQINISRPQTVAALAAIIAAIAVYLFIKKTKTGWSMLAVSQDKDAAALMGIPVQRTYSLAWIIAAALVGFAGAMLMQFFFVFPAVGTVFATTALVIVALGGFGSVEGAFIAGVIIGMLDSFIGFFLTPSLKPVVIFGLYLIVIAFRPSGLMGRGEGT